MRERDLRLARALLWDALILLALALYELLTRLDAMWGPLKMFVRMAIGEHIPLQRVMLYVDLNVFTVPAYMLGCIIVAVWALFARRTRRGCAVLLLPCAVLTVLGFTLRLTLFGELARTLKLLPLLLMLVLCLARVFLRPAPRKAPPAQLPTDPPPVQRRRRAHRRTYR